MFIVASPKNSGSSAPQIDIGTLFALFVLPAGYTVLAKDHAAAANSVRARELAQLS